MPKEKSLAFEINWVFGGSSKIGWCNECAGKDPAFELVKTGAEGRVVVASWPEIFFQVFMRGDERIIARRDPKWEANQMMLPSIR